MIKELSKCNQELDLEHRKVVYCNDRIQQLEKENRVMTRAQRAQLKEMEKLKNKHSALKQKLDKREDYIVKQNCNHRQKIQDNRLVSSQLREQQKEDCNKKIEMIERQYESKIEAVKNDCSKRIAVVKSHCTETLESTRVQCVKLTSLIKNALAAEKKKNSKIVGELEAINKTQANKFCIQLEDCWNTFLITMET